MRQQVHAKYGGDNRQELTGGEPKGIDMGNENTARDEENARTTDTVPQSRMIETLGWEQ